MMFKNAVAVGVVAGLTAIAAAAPGAIGAVAHDEAMMRAEGERCEGAEGYEFVEWVPCADGLMCMAAPELGWGKFCQPMTFRGEGERCMGADGYDPVPWVPCADGLVCEEKPEMGWGKFCAATRAEGERCMGADGYDPVPWIPCADGLECEDAPDMGWGKFCLSAVPVSDLPVFPPGGGAPVAAPDVGPTTAEEPPAVVDVVAEVCTENWETCGGRGPLDTERPCCDEGYECVDAEEEGYEGLRCEPKAV